jgi:hypothetical protein
VSLLQKTGPSWRFTSGRHAGETVDAVAKTDPGYVAWAWRQDGISDDMFYAIDDAARSNGVQTEKQRIKTSSKKKR